MNESLLISKYESIKKDAESVGLSIKTDFNGKFSIYDVPKANGVVVFDTVNDLNNFIYGYILGYKSGL